MTRFVRSAARTLLRSSAVNHAVRALAHLRGHRLVLVYHRVGTSVAADNEIVPSVPVDIFRAQLQALREVVDLVTIDEVLAQVSRRTSDRQRPAVAVTLDDDLPSHAEQALPVLRELGVPAAFFLSGRALHGLGAYWFQHLETLLINYGPRHTAALLRVPELEREQLVLACEGQIDLRRRVVEVGAGMTEPHILERSGIAAVAAAGMTIGFHTVGHDVLPQLDDAALERAVSEGREALATAAGVPVRYFAYPHGKVDARAAAAVRRAGFVAAFTGAARPLRSTDDVYRIGRWEPGPLEASGLLVKLAMRLHTSAAPHNAALV